MTNADRFPIDAELARSLLREQRPTLAGHPIVPQPDGGTTHVLFRLGSDLAIRFPGSPRAVPQCAKEQAWLPRIAPELSIAVPTPIFAGRPSALFAAPWSVVPWIEGEAAWSAMHVHPDALAGDLATFIAELSAAPTAGGPAPGNHNFGRGIALDERDEATRAALRQIVDDAPVRRLLALWERALDAEPSAEPRWIHGDLHGGNLIVRDGRLAGVIDFGGLAVGDPACDLACAWYELGPRARRAFRSVIDPSEASWTRARGWAVSVAAIQLPYYRDRHEKIERLARRTLAAVLQDDDGP
ncbi:MAG: aminoglycoside phosphotransferase family protein [Planctomycetota bacterium]